MYCKTILLMPLLHQIILYVLEKQIMTINDKIRDEKLQYGINIEAAKISALQSGKIYKCEYLTDEKVLSSNQRQILENFLIKEMN